MVATHRNLAKMVTEGTFREDLFYRINVFPIALPPLRERLEDVPLLVNHFIDHFRKELGKPLPGISKKALDILMKHTWLRNVRELKNCLERAAIVAKNEFIQPEYLIIGEVLTSGAWVAEKESQPTGINRVNFNFSFLEEEISLDNIIEEAKLKVLKHCSYNKTREAKLLKRDRNTFYSRQ